MVNTLTLAFLFLTTSKAIGLPAGLLSAICYVESAHKDRVVNIHDGGSPSYGVCQIKYKTARELGFTGTAYELRSAKPNILYAGKLLKRQLNRYKGDIKKAVAAYNSGTYHQHKSGLPRNNRYVKKVFKAWGEGR